MTWNISIKFGQNLKRFSAAGVVSGAFAYSNINKDEISENWHKIKIPNETVHSNLTTMFRVPRFINLIAEDTAAEAPPAPEVAAVVEEKAAETPAEAPAPAEEAPAPAEEAPAAVEEAPAAVEEAPAAVEEAPAAAEEAPPATEEAPPVVEEAPVAVEEASISVVATETVPTMFGHSYVTVACASGATIIVAYVLTKYIGLV